MNFKKCFLALLAGSVFFVSCDNNDDSNEVAGPTGAYADGTFVLNEGNSNPSSASVTFIGDNGTVEQDIYEMVNPGKPALGSYLQSIFFSDDKAFIISGSANKVTVVDRNTFQFVASIDTDFSSPRYGAVINGKAYVTNYANYAIGTDDYLTVIDLNNYSTTKIALNNWSEKIIAENGKLYISNGYYGSGTSITVFNPNTNTNDAVIELGASPESLQEEDGMLYVVGSGKLSRINMATNQVSGTVALPAATTYAAQNLAIEGDKIYFNAGNAVYAMDMNSTTVPAPLFTFVPALTTGGLYGLNVKDGKIYVADRGNFSADSKVYIYSLTGTQQQAYDAGVGPNSFYFN